MSEILTDFDLSKVEGRGGIAKDEIIEIKGSVYDTEGNPAEDASVDIWQANAASRMREIPAIISSD